MMYAPLSISFNEAPTTTDFEQYNSFADAHWGPEDEDPQSIADKFFDMDKSAITATMQDKLVGLLYVHYRQLVFEGKEIFFAGVGGLVTHSDFRNQGIASKLLQYTNQLLFKQGVDAAVLTTEIDRLGKLYEKAGYKPLGKAYIFTDRAGRDVPEHGGMIRAICSQEITSAILNSSSPLHVGLSNF